MALEALRGMIEKCLTLKGPRSAKWKITTRALR